MHCIKNSRTMQALKTAFEGPRSALVLDASGSQKITQIPLIVLSRALIPMETREVQLAETLFGELKKQQQQQKQQSRQYNHKRKLQMLVVDNWGLQAGSVGCLASVEIIGGNEREQAFFKRVYLRGDSAITIVAEPTGHDRPLLVRGKRGKELLRFRGSTYFSLFVTALKQRVDTAQRLGEGASTSEEYRGTAGQNLYELACRIPMSKLQIRTVLKADTASELAMSLSQPLERWEQRTHEALLRSSSHLRRGIVE